MSNPSIFTSVINSYLAEPQASLLNGILFGVKLRTTQVFYQQLKIVGLMHLVVLSGINITLLTTIIGNFTRFLGKRLSIMITTLFIVIFIIFVGPQAPVIRAGFMGILTLVGILYERKTYTFFGLLLSLLFIFLFWPRWLSTVSLQLSYAATLGLILFSNVQEQVKIKSKKFIFKTFINQLKYLFWKEIKPTLAAQVFSTPIIFIYFKQVSLISPLSNLLVSFTIPPLMVFGFLAAFLGRINFYLGLLPAYICYGLLSYLVWVIETLSKLSFAFYQFR